MAKWENGAINEVSIEGLLSEVKLQESKDADGNPVIMGEYKIRTKNVIDGIEIPCEIPVRVYQSKITKNKKENPAYVTAQKIMTDYVSIAAGGEEKATAVRLSERSTSLQENFFLSKTNKQMVYSSGIKASFVNEINKADMNMHAKFKNAIVIGQINPEEKDGEETGRLIIKGILPQWGGRVDVIDFIASNRKVIDHIEKNWAIGDTVLIGGYINFTTRVNEAVDDSSFGEPMIKKSTQSVREYIITGGHESPLTEEEGAYAADDISAAVAERQERIEKAREKGLEGAKKAAAKANFGF